MKPSMICLLAMLPAVLSPLHAQDFDQARATAEAREAVKSFATALKAELVGAMKVGGPENALEVCNLEAMPITEHWSNVQGADISRISLKNRNPQNVPNEWQKPLLEAFDERAAGGEDIAPMASVSVVEVDGKKQFRFVKAVPTEGACLACHGQSLSAGVQSKLDKLYPDDKATGYLPGQVRGAIVVVKDY